MSHYDVLGIPHSADRSTVLAAYRRRAADLKDRLERTRLAESRLEAERLLHDVEEARRVLGDPRRRLAYDLSLIPVSAPARQGPPVLDRPPEPPPALEPRVRSIQWLDEPADPVDEASPPSTPLLEGLATPPPLPGRPWSWRWAGAIALAGLVAFITGMALITGGFRPVMVSPPPPGTLAPAAPGDGVIPSGPISPTGP